jgi:L-ribulose-5-phosphate 3-epimerase
MTKGINYWAFAPEVDGSPMEHAKAMKIARDIGYDAFELTIDSETGPVSLSMTQTQAVSLRNEAEKIGITLNTVASGSAWGVSPTHPDPDVRARAQDNTKRFLTAASWLGAQTILYLPGMVSAVFVPDFAPQPYDKVLEWAKGSLLAALPTAEKLGVRMGVENVWNRFLLSPLEMRDFIDGFDSEMVGSYFDIGNCMLYGHPEHWIDILGNRIVGVHMKDFRIDVGNLNGFVDLLAGDVDFDACFNAFERVGYNGPYTVEYVPGTSGAVEKAFAAMQILEKRIER